MAVRLPLLETGRLWTRVDELRARKGPAPWSEALVLTDDIQAFIICHPPGHPNDTHYHLHDEWWVVLAGELEWELTGGVVFRASKDDIVWVPRGAVHHIRNVSQDLTLRLAVAMPPANHYYSPCEQCGYTDDGPREWCA